MNRAKLVFLNYPEQELEDGIKLYACSTGKAKEEQASDAVNKHDEGEGGIMQALFDEPNYGDEEECAEDAAHGVDNLQEELDNGAKVPGAKKQLPSTLLGSNHVDLQAMLETEDEPTPVVEEVKKAPAPPPPKKTKKEPSEFKPNEDYIKVLLDMGFSEKLSTEALKQCKNSKVEEAVDIAFKLQSQPEF